MIEINSETDFVAKNSEFIKFAEEIAEVGLTKQGKIDDILNAKMKNNKVVKRQFSRVNFKIGEKLQLEEVHILIK